MVSLFEPVSLGPLQLQNRIVMLPMTRCRANATIGKAEADLVAFGAPHREMTFLF